MSTLDDQQLQQFRVRLEQRKAELLGELGESQQAVLGVVAEGGGEVGDFKEQAELQDRHTVRDAEARRDHDELVAVRAALARIAAGSYGECVECGADIGLPRLQAQPEAARCIACQQKAER